MIFSPSDPPDPPDPPIAIIMRDKTTETSVNQLLQVVADEGDPAPAFTCSANGWTKPTLLWERQNGGVALPSRVALIRSGQNQTLAWHRTLEYTDSGNYTCNIYATNGVLITSARLELLVRRECT